MKSLLDRWFTNEEINDFELQLLYQQLKQAVDALGPLGSHTRMAHNDLNSIKHSVDSALRARKEDSL